MRKILLFIVVSILLFSNINGNEKRMNNREGNNFFHLQKINERATNEMLSKSIPFNFHNIFSFILSILFPNLEKF